MRPIQIVLLVAAASLCARCCLDVGFVQAGRRLPFDIDLVFVSAQHACMRPTPSLFVVLAKRFD